MASHASRIEQAARFGYGARGLVHIVIGALALLAAIGSGGATTDSGGALQTLLAQPLGAFILAFVALGLLAFAAWRLIEATTDAEDRGSDAKGLTLRAAHIVSGLIYIGLAVSAASLVIGSGGGEGDGTRDWTAWLMAQPLGRWLTGLAGLIVVGAGIGMLGTAWKASFRKRLACDAGHERWIIPLGRAGYAARGITLAIIGIFVVTAAYTVDPSQARGLGGALRELQQQPYGWALLAMVALGLTAFGIFGFVQARFRRIRAPEPGEMLSQARASV